MDIGIMMTRHRHFLDHLMRQYGVGHVGEAEIDQMQEPRKTWFRWGLGGFDRAEQTSLFLQRFITYSPNMRHLDIGCGPGYLSTFYAMHNFDSIGIDVGDLTHASMNKRDWPDKKLTFLNFDLIKTDALNLGTFDIITVDNVLEHVDSPSVVISRLQPLLSRNGIIYLIIPNSHSIETVQSDPHYRQFGLSLLDKQDGDAMVAGLTDHNSYDVNTWFNKYKIENYYAIFRKYGFDSTLCDDLTDAEMAKRRDVVLHLNVGHLRTDFRNKLVALQNNIPTSLFEKLRYLLDLYLMELENDRVFVMKSIGNRDDQILQFFRAYCSGTWFFILRNVSDHGVQ
jgi:2-polyprenyl-3-methyl-5-hydroxy-6-metoxy-1,4-benzoquinol methylase